MFNKFNIRVIAVVFGIAVITTQSIAGNAGAYTGNTSGSADGAGKTKGAALNDMDAAIARAAVCGNRARHTTTPKYTGFYNNTWWGVTAKWSC